MSSHPTQDEKHQAHERRMYMRFGLMIATSTGFEGTASGHVGDLEAALAVLAHGQQP